MRAMGHSYQQYLPSSPAQSFVDALWISESTITRMGRVLPDGCSDIIFYTNPTEQHISFVGPMTMADPVQVQAGACYVGIRFKPGTLLKRNSLPLELRNKTVPVPAAYTKALSSLQLRHHSPLNLLDELEGWLIKRIQVHDLIRDPEVDCLVDMLQDDPLVKLEALYEALNVSPRTIERRFLKMVGMTPKFFARVQRHQRAAQELLRPDDRFSMARLAHNLHYADQAHFIRDFTSLAGITPGEYQLEHEN